MLCAAGVCHIIWLMQLGDCCIAACDICAQRPYLFRGTLAQLICYPAKFLAHLAAHRPPGTGETLADELEQLVDQVLLGHLPVLWGGWHVEQDWPHILSGGEAQRIEVRVHCW